MPSATTATGSVTLLVIADHVADLDPDLAREGEDATRVLTLLETAVDLVTIIATTADARLTVADAALDATAVTDATTATKEEAVATTVVATATTAVMATGAMVAGVTAPLLNVLAAATDRELPSSTAARVPPMTKEDDLAPAILVSIECH